MLNYRDVPTFWTTCFRFPSFPLSTPLSSVLLTFDLTFCLSEATNFTLTSDSSSAEQTSFSSASRT